MDKMATSSTTSPTTTTRKRKQRSDDQHDNDDALERVLAIVEACRRRRQQQHTGNDDGDDAQRRRWRPARPSIGLLKPIRFAFGLDEHPIANNTLYGGRRRHRASSSLELGIRVHAELELCAEWHPPRSWPPPADALPSESQGAASLHPMTLAILDALNEHRWRLLASEVPLYDAASGIETRADVVAFDEHRGRLVLIEVKTGHSSGYQTTLHTRTARLPVIEPVRDSYETRAHLQLCWMDWALRSYVADGTAVDVLAVVLRVDGAGTRAPEPLRPWARKNQAAIVAAIARAALVTASAIAAGADR